jgi:hypothetical protein
MLIIVMLTRCALAVCGTHACMPCRLLNAAFAEFQCHMRVAFEGRQYAGVVLLFPWTLPFMKVLASIIPDPTMRKVRGHTWHSGMLESFV